MPKRVLSESYNLEALYPDVAKEWHPTKISLNLHRFMEEAPAELLANYIMIKRYHPGVSAQAC